MLKMCANQTPECAKNVPHYFWYFVWEFMVGNMWNSVGFSWCCEPCTVPCSPFHPSNSIPPSAEVGNFRVDPRFHPTLVGWNLGSTRKFSTSTIGAAAWVIEHHCVAPIIACISYFSHVKCCTSSQWLIYQLKYLVQYHMIIGKMHFCSYHYICITAMGDKCFSLIHCIEKLLNQE